MEPFPDQHDSRWFPHTGSKYNLQCLFFAKPCIARNDVKSRVVQASLPFDVLHPSFQSRCDYITA